MRRHKNADDIRASLKRWRSRMVRAANVVNKLELALRRIEKREAEEPKPKALPPPIKETAALLPPSPSPVAEIPPQPHRPPPISEATKKEWQALNSAMRAAFFGGKTKDDQAANELRNQIVERKKAKARGRVAKLKAKQAGELKRMPLSGKA